MESATTASSPEEPEFEFNIHFNQTALAILYERLHQQRECLNRDLSQINRCEEGEFYRGMMGYGFLILCALAVVGNFLNLVVYVTENIRFFIAIRMLCTKLLVNTLTMLFLLPQAMRSVEMWTAGSPTDLLYWKFWPYQALFVNVFGFTGMWLTVLMTAECYVHVFLPLRSKDICTKRNLSRSYAIIGVMAVLLGMIYPLNRTVELRSECDEIVVAIMVADSAFLGIYERFHMCANLLFAIVIPLVLLVFMTAAIVWRLVGRSAFTSVSSKSPTNSVGRFGSEKRTVTRITLITTILQLFSELPSVPIFVFATLFGPSNLNAAAPLCVLQTLSQFLGLCNVSLSFFVYVTFSPRFRRAILSRAREGFRSDSGKFSRSHSSKRLSTTRNDESRLLRDASFRRNGSNGSAETIPPQPNVRFLSISSGHTRLSVDVSSGTSQADHFL